MEPEFVSHGRTLRHLIAADHVIVEAEHTAGTQLESHAHSHPYLVLVLSGSVVEESPRGSHSCGRGMLLVRPSGMRHADRFGATGLHSMIVAIGPTVSGAPAFGDLLDLNEGPSIHLASRLYAELGQADSASSWIVDGLLRELAGTLLRLGDESSAPPRWLRGVHERLKEDWAAPPSIQSLAEEAGVHADHLSRSFRRAYGSLPGEFLRTRRLEWASQQLREAEMTLAAIAAMAGFSDQSHFTRAFRRRFGVPPGRYRREAQRESPYCARSASGRSTRS